MKATNMIAYWLVIIGALNWGLMGIGDFLGANWNVVNLILGGMPVVESVVYVVVGLAAIVSVVSGGCRVCKGEVTRAPQQQTQAPQM